MVMTCQKNLKVNFIKMHDTKFYCCEAIQNQLDKEDHLKLSELYQYGYKFCPYCGTKLSING